MCNIVYLSTDSDEDLAVRNNELIRFEKRDDLAVEPALPLLAFPHRWYVGSKSGCSCTFRHWLSVNGSPCFGHPEDWYPEYEDEIEATKTLYRVIESLLSSGQQVDCLDSWNEEDLDSIQDMEVCLEEVPINGFRLFEGYRFHFKLRQLPESYMPPFMIPLVA